MPQRVPAPDEIKASCDHAAELQEAVMDRALRQQAIFDSAVDFAIIAINRDGRVTDWNIGAERVLGWTADEMRGELVERIFTPEDNATNRVGTEMRLALEHGRASDERWHLRESGSRFWASGEMMPLRDAQDVDIGFLKILRDRTAEHQAEAALHASEALARENAQRVQLALAAGAIIGTWLWDLPTDRFTVDEAFAGVFGIDPAVGRIGLRA